MNKVVLVIVILIILLRKNENFGERFSLMDITSFPINVGKDIDITQWEGVNNSGSSGGLGDTGKTSQDAQMAASTEWTLQWGDVNRRCWSDTTNASKIIGFRKELKAGGGGKLWYLYSTDGKMPAAGNQVQSKYAKVLATVGSFNIPQYLVCLKSKKYPASPDCTWQITTHTCVGNSPTSCNGYGTWNDVYSVVAGPASGLCFDAYGNALTNATNASVPVTGGLCTLPLCPTGFDEGVPGAITAGTPQVGSSTFSGKTTLADCLKACNTTIGCKYFQFNSSPNSCAGYKTGATMSQTTGNASSWVYTRVGSTPVTVTDPSFEAYAPAISALTTGTWRDNASLISGDSGFSTGAWTASGGLYFNKYNTPWGGSLPADGSVYAALQMVAAIQQSVTVIPGSTYTVSWKMRGRVGWPAGALNDLNVSLNGTTIFNEINISDTGNWVSRTSSLWTAPSGVTSPILRFYSTNPLTGDHSVFIDNISMATEFSPVKYQYIAAAPCTSDIVAVRTACSPVSGCDTIGQQTNGCWHCLGPGGSSDTTYYSSALLKL